MSLNSLKWEEKWLMGWMVLPLKPEWGRISCNGTMWLSWVGRNTVVLVHRRSAKLQRAQSQSPCSYHPHTSSLCWPTLANKTHPSGTRALELRLASLKATVRAPPVSFKFIGLQFQTTVVNWVSNDAIQIQVFNALIQMKQYKFKLCNSNWLNAFF